MALLTERQKKAEVLASELRTMGAAGSALLFGRHDAARQLSARSTRLILLTVLSLLSLLTILLLQWLMLRWLLGVLTVPVG